MRPLALPAALGVALLAGSPATASAQLPLAEITSPPPGHHADPSLRTYVFRVGPFSVGGYQTFRHNDVVTPPPEAGSIVGMDVRIVDTTGVEIPQAQLMLHHDVFTNGGPDDSRKDGSCPNNAVRERFYGTSEELRPLTLPRGYGYPTTPADHWKTRCPAEGQRAARRSGQRPSSCRRQAASWRLAATSTAARRSCG